MSVSQKSSATTSHSKNLYSKTKFDISKLSNVEYLNDSIRVVNNENTQLKTKLLGLINEYKILKQIVLNNNDFNYKKRSFTEIENEESMRVDVAVESSLGSSPVTNATTTGNSTTQTTPVPDPRDFIEEKLDLDMALDSEVPLSAEIFQDTLENELGLEGFEGLNLKLNTAADARPSHNISDFIEEEELLDEEFDDFHDDMDSPLLSRTSSPMDDDNHSLMATLTRSTTVSTNNSFMDKMPTTISMQLAGSSNQQSRFFELPKFNENYSNKPFKNLSKNFDVLQQDQYNLINDFLEEKLIDNDLNYYENLKAQDD